MESKHPEHQFDQLLNFRDVGKAINSSTRTVSLNPHIFYRSARPDKASRADRAYLTKTLGIRTIIDLRSKTEHLNAAKKHASVATQPMYDSGLISESNESVSLALQIPGINYAEINLNGGAFERALLWQLKYSSLARLLWLMACGYREEAISILGREAMLPRGLIGLGIDTVDHSTNEIRNVFNILANESSYPVLVHCTQGKDRTGLIVLLVLMLCGVDAESISGDYVGSEEELLVEKEERLREILRIGLSEDFAGCPPNFVKEVTKHMQEKYGGIEKYLTTIGIDEKAQSRLCGIMIKS
jgi:protein-tyrosine phosphatase